MIRKAQVQDVQQIQELVNKFAKQDLMLARSLNELYENLRNLWVYEARKKVVGCCALQICWDTLAEIKSLAVRTDMQRKGVGSQLVSACIDEARVLGAKRVFVLTYKPKFFKCLGFSRVKNSSLPHKIWADCIHCPKFPNCQEVAMIRKI
jgi:amino-acid N-acetyltransferase